MKAVATDFAQYLRSFLTHYLPIQRNASPNTISGYRYAFLLLLRYCQQVRKLPLEQLRLEQIDASLVVEFLDHIEKKRGSSSTTRNHRLAAVHSLFRYVQTQAPEHIALCQRVLAIPARRVNRGEPTSLTPLALAALLDQPDRSTRKGRRDVVLLSVLYDTGARVQELIDLRVRDVRLDAPATVQLTGKGRKTRLVPLLPGTARLLGQYLREEALLDPGRSEEWLFRNQRNGRFSRWGVRYLMQKYSDGARATCSAFPRRVTPHSLRHSKAIHLLQAGNPTVVIRDILGHADIQSTEIYARVDLEMKRRALEKAADTSRRPALPPWHRKPDLLRWLESM